MSDKTLHVEVSGPIMMNLLVGGPQTNPLTADDLAPYDDDQAILYCQNCDIRASISVLRAWLELATMTP